MQALLIVSAVLACLFVECGARYAVVEMYSAPMGCQNCTCVNCPCVAKEPKCKKCGDDNLVARIAVVPDGVCHETRMLNLHPFVERSALAPLNFMAAVCTDGLWLAADGPTRPECELRGSGLVAAFEKGEIDAQSATCLPGGSGSYIKFLCPDDELVQTTAPEPKTIISYITEGGGVSSQRTWLQYLIAEISETIPLVVPPALLVLYISRHNLPDLGSRRIRALAATIGAALFFIMVAGSTYSY
eukprot:TRINITY_DN38780_c0_g1_i1.p1 TRINITY_DN38780_c0_g1~~TRINITY_DN38780_c0_g1_i1.p1  ORF type:complete len:244 (+),score=30.86 TRINITY_DN38780_c0_g1_i1:51-782(+)